MASCLNYFDLKTFLLTICSQSTPSLHPGFLMSIEYKKNTKEYKRVQNIRIEISEQKYNQVRLVLAVFASTKLMLNYINQVRCN